MTPTCAYCRAAMPGANPRRRTCSERCRTSLSVYRRHGHVTRRRPAVPVVPFFD